MQNFSPAEEFFHVLSCSRSSVNGFPSLGSLIGDLIVRGDRLFSLEKGVAYYWRFKTVFKRDTWFLSFPPRTNKVKPDFVVFSKPPLFTKETRESFHEGNS